MKRIIALAPVALIMGLTGHVQAATQTDVQLQGTIVDTTCEVAANNGAATLNVGSFSKTAFDAAKKQIGQEPLVISLANCSEDEAGALQVTGVVGTENNMFLSDTSKSAGFMLKQSDDTTQVTNNTSIPVVANENGALTYTFTAGMAVMDTANIEPGAYTAPIKISYVNN
ncbi:fimbrial protein [Yersinia frederiksenii]|uniref:fimbrial protein n=1 Tax=Yersinia frederiksenii TaxID=29484 RepID=UPI0005E10671|nr:fimbrial protein [Yersinia frederiksenii]CQH17289.1 fimbrial protein [Yersinia frederiksenii]